MNDELNIQQQLVQQFALDIEKEVIGQGHVVKSLLIGLLTNGHVLLEGLPGTAKTRSVKVLAALLNTSFGRVQFTPDLLPSDVTGTQVYQDTNGSPQLCFQAGPIFNSLVLADEINRAPAKVQAALLEAMAEGCITVGDETHSLPELFMVLATQNPVDQQGTYPLPEAQMDRFMMKVRVDYPDDEAEREIIRLVRNEESDNSTSFETTIQDSVSSEVIFTARKQIGLMGVSELIEKYIVALVMATRKPNRYATSKLMEWIDVGASPRASIALDKCSRANAWLHGRDHVTPDDVRAVAHAVLGHRVSLSYNAMAQGVSAEQVVTELLDHVEIG